jgi:hypothetical protein
MMHDDLLILDSIRLNFSQGGMAFIAAWWGIWHILAGLGLAAFWAYVRPVRQPAIGRS